MEQQVRIDPVALQPAFDLVRHHVARGDLPSAVLAVGDRRGALRCEAITRPGGHEIRTNSIFFLTSVTKPIFATAVMQLIEDGSLALHEPLRRYLPRFAVEDSAGDKAAVTPWHILTHTSGLEDISGSDMARRRMSPRQIVGQITRAPLRFTPGTRFEYTSASFYLLGELIRELTGLPYPDYLKQRLFVPLKMVDTGFDLRRSRARLVPVHGAGFDSRLRQALVLRYLAAAAPPGGGLWGTADDLVRFGQALLASGDSGGNGNDRPLLSPGTVELMTRLHTCGIPQLVEGQPRAVHYALGWGKATLGADGLPGSPRAYEHGGVSGTRLWIDPDVDLVFVFLTNQWNAPTEPSYAVLGETYRSLDAPSR